jgi:hypothetical protein
MYQDYYNFYLDIPQTAIIEGIAVMGEGHGEGGAQSSRTGIYIYSASADEWVGWQTWLFLGDNNNEDTTDVVGGPTELWGTSWIPSDFSNHNFLLKLYQPVATWGTWLNQIKVGVYYTDTDLNGDGINNFYDSAILAGQWLQPPATPSADIAPYGGDGLINYLDLARIFEQWLKGL